MLIRETNEKNTRFCMGFLKRMTKGIKNVQRNSFAKRQQSGPMSMNID